MINLQAIKEEKGRLWAVAAAERQVFSGLAMKVMRSIAGEPKYPRQIARELRVHEQKVYYHIRQLEKKGFVRVARKEEKGGALAKVYEPASPAFLVRFGNFQEIRRLPRTAGFEPFIRDGMLDAKIIVGSPEPHGPEKARSRDISFAVELALFLGTFLTKTKGMSVIEDKDVHSHDLNANLIIIGGPITNKVTKMVNDKLPARFDAKKNIASSKSKKTYKMDECGFIARAKNPFDERKEIIVIAGKRYSGTKAAVLAFMQKFDEIEKKSFSIVEGLDNDGDGEVDSVRVLE